MTDEELGVIEEAAERATRGPWLADPLGLGGNPAIWTYSADGSEAQIGTALTHADRQFIAHAHEYVPRLIEEVRRLRRLLAAKTDAA